MLRVRLVAVWVAVAVAASLSACAADNGDGAGSSTGPTVADSRFDGSHRLVAVEADGVGVPIPSVVLVQLDSAFGATEIETGCGRMLGAFSLFDDGTGGVTIAGGTTSECSADEAAFDDTLRTVLARVTSWDDTADGLVLSDSSNQWTLTLER